MVSRRSEISPVILFYLTKQISPASFGAAKSDDVAEQQNNNTAIDPRKAEVSLTGHSLGGGLAGLAASNDNHRATKLRVAC